MSKIDQAGEIDIAMHRLGTGTLTLKVASSEIDGLFRLAERQNPKRAFLFVSTVLGRHIPVLPSAHRSALDTLAEKVLAHLLEGPVFVMGYAETAVGIGAGVFDSLRARRPDRPMGYLHTTRHAIEGLEPWFEIVEGHSHATDHLIYHPGSDVCRPGPDSTLVLVDDETTTGKTFSELASGLFENGAKFGKIILVTLTDWSDNAASTKIRDVTGAPVVSVSLLSGAWSWLQDPAAKAPNLPPKKSAECPIWQPDTSAKVQSPRLGICGDAMSRGSDLLEDLTSAIDDARSVLVIGTGENVWLPFLCAEEIERSGRYCEFIATTRSPILPGPVIEHKITFPDHYGIGLDMYLHNVDPSQWDAIILFTETGFEGIHNDLRTALGKGWIVNGSGEVAPMVEG